ncbi:MAG: sigma 54-interacting transcriptional regulator [Myxococcales bacterium]|nr:sigma 54-interacting transcriptional regulator [Myxococcales bacterium]
MDPSPVAAYRERHLEGTSTHRPTQRSAHARGERPRRTRPGCDHGRTAPAVWRTGPPPLAPRRAEGDGRSSGHRVDVPSGAGSGRGLGLPRPVSHSHLLLRHRAGARRQHLDPARGRVRHRPSSVISSLTEGALKAHFPRRRRRPSPFRRRRPLRRGLPPCPSRSSRPRRHRGRGGGPGSTKSRCRRPLLLDEVVDLPLAVHAKVLRAIEAREVVPLGETRPVQVEVRLVAAAQASLHEAVAQRRFRADLRAGRAHPPPGPPRLTAAPEAARESVQLVRRRDATAIVGQSALVTARRFDYLGQPGALEWRERDDGGRSRGAQWRLRPR